MAPVKSVGPNPMTSIQPNRNMAYLGMMEKNGQRCSVCHRVCGWVEKDGICGSPVCRN